MKTSKGDYEGASVFAYFDTPVEHMTFDERGALLTAILHRAMPGEDNSEVMFELLAVAEQTWREQGGPRL